MLRVSEHQRGHVHEVFGSACSELEPDEPVEVHDAHGTGLRKSHFHGPRPLDGDELGHDVHPDPGDGGLDAGEVPFQGVTALQYRGHPVASEPPLHFRE